MALNASVTRKFVASGIHAVPLQSNMERADFFRMELYIVFEINELLDGILFLLTRVRQISRGKVGLR